MSAPQASCTPYGGSSAIFSVRPIKSRTGSHMPNALLSQDQIELAGRAYAAIGPYRKGDEQLDIDGQLAALPCGPEANDSAGLREVLSRPHINERLRQQCSEYKVHDAAAAAAKHFYNFAMKSLIAAGIGLSLLF